MSTNSPIAPVTGFSGVSKKKAGKKSAMTAGLGLPDHAIGHSDLRGHKSEICDEKESGDDGGSIPWAEKGEYQNTRVQDDWQSLEDLAERCRW
jgi:hypothetical protein